MEQIKQILQQLALHLELNIAMCDKIDDHNNRIEQLELHYKAQKTRLDTLYRLVSEADYVLASNSYEARRAALRGNHAESKNTSEDQ